MYDYLVIGAGLYGSVFAQQAKAAGKSVLVIDKRDHIAGNVYTEKVEGIDVHKYGAHIFHTNNQEVWDYVNRFVTFNRFTNSPVANYKGELYSLPFNMYTFNRMWGVVTPDEAAGKMKAAIAQARAEEDSVGGVIQCRMLGVPAGLGEPMFGGLENRISQLVFAIPAVKGIEFGLGFEAAKLRGSENNDAYRMENGSVVTEANHCGGILGGISNGMPIVFRAAVKPTPSIGKPQNSVRLSEKQNEVLHIHGRHDPCIVPRAVPCMEAAAAIAIFDALAASGTYRR